MDTEIQSRFRRYRIEQMVQLGFWIAGPVAIALVLEAGFADYGLYPEQWSIDWFYLRLGIIPVGCLAMVLYRRELGRRLPELGIFLVVSYISAIHLWIIARTGYEKSNHFHAFPQCVLGLALLPFRPLAFAAMVAFVLGTYVAFLGWTGHLSLAGFAHGDIVWLTTYVLMGIFFYCASELARRRAYALRSQLEDEVSTREERIRHLVTQQVELEEKRIASDFAEQVAHDIRSPLTALKMFVSHLKGLTEEERLLGNSVIARLSDIAGLLLTDAPRRRAFGAHPGTVPTHWLFPLVDRFVAEKRVQYRSRKGITLEVPATADAARVFLKVPRDEFLRVLSNLIDNAVEAMCDGGSVTLHLTTSGEKAELRIEDTGRGIAPDVLPRLMKKGATFGKVSGSGLGLYHARESIIAWGGTLELHSREGCGACVRIVLPLAAKPSWFVPEIDLRSQRPIVVLDDDPSVHELWRIRVGKEYPQDHFYDISSLRAWFREQPDRAAEALFLLDYELRGSSVSGLDALHELALEKRAVLVTHRFEDEELLRHCEAAAVKLVPKSMVSTIAIGL